MISLTGLSGTGRGLAMSTASRRESAFQARRFDQMDEFQLAWISCGNFYGNFKCITSCCSARSTFSFLRAYERIAKTAKQLKSIYNENERRKRKCAIAQWNDGKLFFAKSAHNHCQPNNNNKSSINFQPKTILKWNFIRVKWCRSYSRCALRGWL